MTQEQFDGLPGLLSRKDFVEVTGLTTEMVRSLVDAKQVKVWRPRGRRYAKYYKREAARLAGFMMK